MITIFLPILLLDILILIIYVDSPLSLQSQCRLTVRRAMGGGGLAARVDQDQKQTNWKILELGETMDTVCVCVCCTLTCLSYLHHPLYTLYYSQNIYKLVENQQSELHYYLTYS